MYYCFAIFALCSDSRYLETYLVFVALQCLAVPLALALTPPEKVQRSDGSKVKIVAEKSVGAELRALGRALSRRDVSRLHVPRIASNTQSRFFCCCRYSGQRTSTNIVEVSSSHSMHEDVLMICYADFQTYYFGVRARALSGFLSKI